MRLRLALLQGVVSIHASFDVATQIKHMQAKKSSAESVALLESVVQSRVLRKKIGEEFIPLQSKHKSPWCKTQNLITV